MSELPKMDLKDYITLVSNRIDAAGDQGDRAEVLRLLVLLRDTLDDAIRKIEQEL